MILQIGNPINLNEMKLFDRDANGGDEITAAIGIISNCVSFDKWRPLIPFGIRDLSAIIGQTC